MDYMVHRMSEIDVFASGGKIVFDEDLNATYAVLLLLHLKNSAIVESPLDDVSLLLRLSELAALQSAPEALEVLDCWWRGASVNFFCRS